MPRSHPIERRPSLRMTWRNLCFLHWRVDPEPLRAALPPGLELDTYDGSAWLGVVPFEMRDTRFTRLPPLPSARHFPELNLRTYVRSREHAGVWFFSLDAASWLAVRGARATFALPYFDARMSIEQADDGGWLRYRSVRRRGFGAPPAQFAARYRPTGDPQPASPGSLEHFLVERYCLFAQNGFGVRHSLRRGLLRGAIEHVPWPLQPAECELETCDMFRVIGLEPPREAPLAHFVRELDVQAHTPVHVLP